MTVKTRVYPQPGTHAETVATFVSANPGVTTNGIIVGLKMNPSYVRRILRNLLHKEVIEDRPDGDQNHHYHTRRHL